VPYTVVQVGPDGNPCQYTSYRPPGIVAPEDVNAYDGGTRDPTTHPTCPYEPAASNPEVIAAQFWERVPLPAPEPHIAPGWAITGKLAYLETRGTLSRTFTADTPLGHLRIRATGRYYVDWGDGHRTGPYSREGQPWPNGQITHDYLFSGEYDVVVAIRWSGEWSLAGNSGRLRDVDTAGRIDDFPVRQIQAVVISGR